MSEREQIYKQLFGSKPTIDDEVNELKRDIINDMCEYEQIESAYVPANVTIDNVSVSCGDVVLAAKVISLLIINNVNNDKYSQADCDALFNDLKYSLYDPDE